MDQLSNTNPTNYFLANPLNPILLVTNSWTHLISHKYKLKSICNSFSSSSTKLNPLYSLTKRASRCCVKMSKAGLEDGVASKATTGANRGISILDFIFRIVAGAATLGSAIAMGTTNETLPFFTQFIRFRAEYDDLPTFTFFVVANAIITGYLVLSLAISIFHIVRSAAKGTRILLVILDTAALGLLTAAASASAAIVYLAHKGNASANWFAICQQYNSFCERISGSLIGSFVAIVLFVLLILLSAIAISRRH